jgi:hypothetical protein
MNRLQTELQRLYRARNPKDTGPGSDETGFIDAEGRVRALVLELARPADWSALALLWHGVQEDLALPAPAIAVNGVDGFQLWFSLLEPVPVAEAQVFLEGLRLRYLGDVVSARVDMRPAAEVVPAVREETGQWSAFIARDLAAVFADEPWLDMCPSPEAQADVLSRLKSIKPVDFQTVLAQLGPAEKPAASEPATARRERGAAAPSDPKRFLLDVMGDAGIELHLRIEAARALLPYFETPRKG